MSATKTAATAAGRALLKAGSRTLPAAVRGGGRGGGSKVARGIASVTLNQHDNRGTHGVLAVGAAACAAAVGLAALVEAEDLEGMVPAFLLEKLQQQGSSAALARIDEVSRTQKYVVNESRRGR